MKTRQPIRNKGKTPDKTHPGREKWKATNKEMEERLELTAKMLIEGKTEPEIKEYWLKTLGLRHRQVGEYFARVRQRAAARRTVSYEELFWQQSDFYLKIQLDPTASNSDRIRAGKARDKLHGLYKPMKFALTNPEGDESYKLVIEGMTPEQLRVIDELGQVMERISKGVEPEDLKLLDTLKGRMESLVNGEASKQ